MLHRWFLIQHLQIQIRYGHEFAVALGEVLGLDDGGHVDHLDGLSVDYEKWRFNVRISNTEPVVRLNVETRADKQLLAEKTQEILELIGGEEA